MKDKIITLKSEFESNFKERHDEINGALLAILSGEHVLFLGPPGTAKSLLAHKMCQALDGGNFFYYLLTRYTTPDEIFGPLSIKSLQEDRFNRKIEKHLPTSHVAFLDEIFKANSSILNSLLTILNERKFHNGQEVIEVPLLSVFGASNELPEEEESLEALYDRFLFRFFVTNVQDETNFKELIFGRTEDYQPSVRISVDEIGKIQKKAESMKVDEDVNDIFLELRKHFRSENIQISDRRWKKILRVMRIASASIGRNTVDRTMAMLLQHMLWDKPEQREQIRNIVIDYAISGGVSLDTLKKDVDDLHSLVKSAEDYRFPEPVQCYTCDKKFQTWNQLAAHASKEPDHDYYVGREVY